MENKFPIVIRGRKDSIFESNENSCISRGTLQSRVKRSRNVEEERERAKEFEKVGKFQLVNPLFPPPFFLFSFLSRSFRIFSSIIPSFSSYNLNFSRVVLSPIMSRLKDLPRARTPPFLSADML